MKTPSRLKHYVNPKIVVGRGSGAASLWLKKSHSLAKVSYKVISFSLILPSPTHLLTGLGHQFLLLRIMPPLMPLQELAIIRQAWIQV